MLNQIVRSSLLLVGLVTALSILVQITGLNGNFVLGPIIFIVGAIALNLFVVYGALAAKATENSYGQQVFLALGIGVLAGVLITLVSWLLLSYVFPGSMDEMRQAATEYMQSNNTQQDEFDRQMTAINAATPFSQSLPGGLGTVTTSLVAGLLIGWFRRRK